MLRLIVSILRILTKIGRFLHLGDTATLIDLRLMPFLLSFQLTAPLGDNSKTRIVRARWCPAGIQDAIPQEHSRIGIYGALYREAIDAKPWRHLDRILYIDQVQQVRYVVIVLLLLVIPSAMMTQLALVPFPICRAL
jgi:hypothetical protein